MKVKTSLLARVSRFNRSSFCLLYLKLVFLLRVCLGQEISRKTELKHKVVAFLR